MTAVEATPITKEEQSKPLALRVGAELVGSFIICFAIYAICSLGSAVYGINMAFIALLTGIVGTFCTRPAIKTNDGGWVDVDWFRIDK